MKPSYVLLTILLPLIRSNESSDTTLSSTSTSTIQAATTTEASTTPSQTTTTTLETHSTTAKPQVNESSLNKINATNRAIYLNGTKFACNCDVTVNDKFI